MFSRLLLSIFLVIAFLAQSFSQTKDSIFFNNFVNHSDGSECKHTPPDASFIVYLNSDHSKILLENAPRWSPGSDQNITGKGVFGIEIGNFIDPSAKLGDTVFIIFTCSDKKEQGSISESISGLPWWRFPVILSLVKIDLPSPISNLSLVTDSKKRRILSWTKITNIVYHIYRRPLDDILTNGSERKLYSQIAKNVSDSVFIDSTGLPNKKYAYIIIPENLKKILGQHSAEISEIPPFQSGEDIDVGFIARLPRIDYVWNSENPKIWGWPTIGQTVTWQANVKNWFDHDLDSVGYKWYLDGKEVSAGKIKLISGKYTPVEFPWQWSFERHELKFVIDPESNFLEEEEGNNEISVFTDAISVGFYVEQSTYNYFKRYQKDLGVHSNSWDDWAQRHVKRWNQMFADAKYPESPEGVLDRIRLDNITIVQDGKLPLAGGLATNNPNMNDRTIDLQWGFPAKGVTEGTFYANHTSVSDNNPFYFEGSLMHELGHARYLIDLYGFNVHDNGSGNTIAIKEDGKPIVGSKYMPLSGDAVYYTPIKGLMNGQYTYVDRYSAAAMNLIAGCRAVSGNYNAPGNIGVFMQDLPLQNRLTVKDNSGNLLKNADINLYQASGQQDVWYGKYFDNDPDLFFRTDSNGQVLLGKCPFSKTGKITHTYGFSNGIVILRIELNDKVGFAFLESTWFNLQYWSGKKELGDYEISVNLFDKTNIVKKNEILPVDFILEQNYPNPFNSGTIINYTIPKCSEVKLALFDIYGREIRLLSKGKKEAGNYQAGWDGKNNNGEYVSSGVYFFRLEYYNGIKSAKLIYLK